MACIYTIRSPHSPRVYVGSTRGSDYRKGRWNQHLQDLKLQRHSNAILQRIYNKYGIAALQFEVFERDLDFTSFWDVWAWEKAVMVWFESQGYVLMNFAEWPSGFTHEEAVTAGKRGYLASQPFRTEVTERSRLANVRRAMALKPAEYYVELSRKGTQALTPEQRRLNGQRGYFSIANATLEQRREWGRKGRAKQQTRGKQHLQPERYSSYEH